jgi:four helix bundle protein
VQQKPVKSTEDRMIAFGVRIIAVADALPRTPAGKHIAGQLLRAGTSPAPNYAEASSAESRQDFVHKLGIVLKELNETRIWLRMILQADLVKPARLEGLLDENTQLCRIIKASIKTARLNLSTAH